MTVVRREARRRWLAVAAGAAVLVALPALAHAIPVHATGVPLDTLVARIAASARQPYQGYAVSTGTAGLPSLPQLDAVTGLFDGDTSLRIWYTSPKRWRVDTIDLAGERDVYHAATTETVWDSAQNQLSEIVGGDAPVRLPRGTDLAPPDLARRLLAAATAPASAPGTGPTNAPGTAPPTDAATGGQPGTMRTALPARRVAGISAAGLRLTPTDPQTTVAHVDIWADPATGLPVEVELSAKGATSPVLVSRMLDLTLTAPPVAVMTPPPPPPDAGYTVTTNPDVVAALRDLGLGELPDTLGGLSRINDGLGVLPGIGAYGAGFRQVVAVSVPGRTGFQAFRAARDVGGTVYKFPNDGQGVLVSTPLISVLVVTTDRRGGIYLVAGLVGADLLTKVGSELSTFVGPGR